MSETENIITKASSPNEDERLNLGNLPEGVIGLTSNIVEKKKPVAKKKTTKKADETVALYAERNMVWSEVGSLSKGYNIVPKEKAERWLTRPRVRLVEPEEIAREYKV